MALTEHGNAKMADLSVANVDIHILLKVFGILLEYLRKTKRKLLEYFVLGVPIYQLRFITKVCDETIKKFFRVIRKLLSIEEECTEPFTGEIECDETTFGGKRHGKRGWGAAGKIIVFGILKQDGQIRVFPIAEEKKILFKS